MRVFLNELALVEACASANPSFAPLEELLKARLQHRVLRESLYCARGMPTANTALGITLADIGRRMPRDKIGLLFDWVTKRGPFIEDDRQDIDQDLFFFDGEDVTDLGLGEAARRVLANDWSATFSPVRAAASRFGTNPLDVVYGLPEEPIRLVPVPNHIRTETLVEKLHSEEPEPKTWHALLNLCRERFDHLVIGVQCDIVLARRPYVPSAGRRILALLGTLQELKGEMDCRGQLSAFGIEVRNEYFRGERALFSDESDTRKASPKDFTFADPAGDGSLICFWHGKISTPPFRIHFEWPVSRPTERLCIAYIGPKIRPDRS